MASTVSKVDYKSIKWRINNKRRPVKRYPTNLESFDEYSGGLPGGLTIIYGPGGCGKSLLARTIAIHSDSCLYLACEVQSDAPLDIPHVAMIDYTTHRPNFKRAIDELGIFIEQLEPDLVIIDSLTTFLSVTNKALGESDLRAGISQIHSLYEGKVPIIGISEIRGTGYSRSTAGGEGVKHACTMLIAMEHEIIQYPSTAESYNMEIGDDVYTIRVEKDKHNKANNKLCKVILKDGIPNILPIRNSLTLGKRPLLKKNDKTNKKKSGWNS